MALHGSVSANLSPMLFKGNNRALGVNVLIHQDESGSMDNLIQFYSNGTFIGALQDALLVERIGTDLTNYPNLYAYFGRYSRNSSSSFSITNPNGTLNVTQAFMRGEATGSATISKWTGANYFTNKTTHIANICTDVVGTTTGGRLKGSDQDTEDVHGNLWSIFTTPNAISTGTPGRFGSILGSNVRKGSTTIVITNSNEQDSAPPDMINQLVDVPPIISPNVVCISVTDEVTPNNSTITSDWLNFRATNSTTPFWILVPGSVGGIFIPTQYSNDQNAYGPIPFNRNAVSDWFTICRLNLLPRGAIVSLAIDNSGSMTSSTVQTSINLITEKCQNAGLILQLTTYSDERWAIPHTKSFGTYTQRTINDSTGELITRRYRVIALSSYTSTDGFDGVLFYGSTSTQPYGYVTFTGASTYTITRSTTAPNTWARSVSGGAEQLQDTLTLARETRGGLFKIGTVFTNTGNDYRVAFSKCIAEFVADTI